MLFFFSVAVLAIFEEIHVNIGLYFLVFGESLFNDGVTVVLYNTMISLVNMTHIPGTQIAMAILSFFCVVLGMCNLLAYFRIRLN